MNRCFGRKLIAGALAILLTAGVMRGPSQADEPVEVRYLAFQIFTGSPDATIPIGGSGVHPLGSMPARPQLDALVQDIMRRIGTVGGGQTQLAVIFGPLALDHSDAEIRGFVKTAFAIALERKIAVGFHIDDSMFWARRSDLWHSPDNVEWLDWDGTPATGRRIDWGPRPQKLPPPMCFNSKAIQREVRGRAEVIGKAIKSAVDGLKRQGKERLFAGVIAGWETQIGQDFDTGRYLGYHALRNRGFSKSHPPGDMDGERETIVEEFITLWAQGLADAGVPASKIYAHTAFLSKRIFEASGPQTLSYSQHNHFAPPSVAFGASRRPGFTTYPQPGLFEQIYAELARHGQPPWASSEGTNLQLGSGPGQSGMNMESYLARSFNHGATLVNIFSWGVGGEAHKNMDFRVVTEGEEALRAYRKFLRGQRLVEVVSPASSYLERLPAKIHRIQRELPAWAQKTGNQAKATALSQRLDAALKAKDFTKAEKIADEILELLPAK
ncbi:MAG: hypothetical protein ACLQLG_03515 [Thermoguttaceae bacterium]